MPCQHPDSSASFGVYLDYYAQRKEINQSRLAACARLNQPYLNKIANGKVKNVPIEAIVNVCLALQLSQDEAKDLLARRERAFSPANPAHQVYMELIGEYHKKTIDYKDDMEVTNFLLEADKQLQRKGFPPLPDADRG